MHKASSLSLLVAALLLGACTSSGVQQSSGITVPISWTRLEPAAKADTPLVPDANAGVDHEWWKHFGDPMLDSLIAEALDNNKSLQVAKARVEEARANRGVARSALFPQISASAGVTRENQGLLTNNQTYNISNAELDATWEIDLFGKNQARVREAAAILESEDAASQAVRIGLLAEVARNYFDLRNYQRQIALTRENLETQNKTLQLITEQLRGGYASDFDVQRAAAQVSTTDAQIPQLEAASDAALARLNILLGLPPGSKDVLLKTGQDLQPLDQRILVAAPAAVLAARPDVRAAERRFAASISAKQAATAELFPDISLTALFGAQDSTLLSATPWGIGLNLVQPILNFGRIESQIDAADARQKQAFLTYQQTVLEALENMEDALSSYLRETTRNASLAAAVQQNRKAQDFANQQYESGLTGLLDLLVVQRNLLDAESGEAASDANLRKDLVSIYTAAGGGWRSDTVQAATPQRTASP